MSDYIQENKNSLSLKAWKDFIQKLDDAGQTIIGEFGAADARERAEGFRYLTRLLSIGLDLHLEHDDAEHPTFTRMITDTRKFIGDNPDAEYDYATLSPKVEYMIKGQRGISDYLAFCLYGHDDSGKPNVGSNLCDTDMQINNDGSFELYIATENRLNHPNFIAMNETTDSIVIRQYFTGERTNKGTYTIEAISNVANKKTFDEEQLALHLGKVGDFVKDISTSSSVLSIFAALNSVSSENQDKGEVHEVLEIRGAEMDARGRPSAEELANKIDPSAIALHMPTPDIQYSGSWWEIKPGEAVVIEGKPLDCCYWSIQIFNRWLESPDYRYNKVSINSSEVDYEEDGSFRVILAPEGKGLKNWISTDGFTSGQVCYRALLAKGAPEVTYRIEKIENLIQ